MYLRQAAKAGTRLTDAAIDFRRPGFGLGPELFDSLAQRTFRCDLPAGHMLELANFS
jgi:N,N'-diacetyllegionaminate synthase